MQSSDSYRVNEIFYSLQGEGVRAGTPNVFVRFTGCNLTCSRAGFAGFDCDTEFISGVTMERAKILADALALVPSNSSFYGVGVIFTGGEPGLQLDADLVELFKCAGFVTCCESNGTCALPPNLDWITISPKSAEHTLIQPLISPGQIRQVDELKYVRHQGQGIPKPSLQATHRLISPAIGPAGLERGTLEHCIKLCKENPPWRLSVQQHKAWSVR